MASLYVSGLPHYVKDWDLRNFFRKYGRVVNVRLNAGQRRGSRSGFVSFAENCSAEQALQDRHPLFLGRRIHVSTASAATPLPNPYGPPMRSGSSVKSEFQPHFNPAPTPLVEVKTEPRLPAEPPPCPVMIKQEPCVLRPELPMADPFRKVEFSVSANPFSNQALSRQSQVDGSFWKTEGYRQEEPTISSATSVGKKAMKRPLPEVKDKSKKKVMAVGDLKLPRSAAEFMEANKKHFQEKTHGKSPDEDIPPEIMEEKEKIVSILNDGTPDKLQRLQLIGRKKAEAIITYRRLRGKFRKVEDLAKISLFGDQFMQRFKEANFLV